MHAGDIDRGASPTAACARHRRLTRATTLALVTRRQHRCLASPGSGQRSVAIELTTFGGLHVVGDTGGLDRRLAQHSRMALFVYMAVERRVSRESVTALFWPESDAENARHALRQSLYHLRKAIGDDWIDARAHELAVRDNVHTDSLAFTDALQFGDLETAVRLYRGPFLDGVHLVDLKPWESWVDGRRAQYARAFRKGCRDLLDAKRAAGDLSGAIQAAERWIERTPADDEAQHRLIEALATAGERAEAVRQYAAYLRLVGRASTAVRDTRTDRASPRRGVSAAGAPRGICSGATVAVGVRRSV